MGTVKNMINGSLRASIEPQFNEVEQDFSSLTELGRAIKRKLLPSRSWDPEVQVQVPYDLGSFEHYEYWAPPRLELVEGVESTVSCAHTPLDPTHLWMKF